MGVLTATAQTLHKQRGCAYCWQSCTCAQPSRPTAALGETGCSSSTDGAAEADRGDPSEQVCLTPVPLPAASGCS